MKHGGDRRSRQFYTLNYTNAEIAEELGVTQRGACWIEHQALKKFLKRFGEKEAREYLEYFNEMRRR